MNICYLITETPTDTMIIRSLLQKKGIKVTDLYDYDVDQDSMLSLKEKIQKADFAIAVLNEPSSEMFYELGLCEGMGKPILILSEKDQNLLYLRMYPYVKVKLANQDILDMALTQFINSQSSIKPKSKKEKKKYITQNQRAKLQMLLEKLPRIRENGTGYDFELLVNEVFDTADFGAVKNDYSKGDNGTDFAIWNDQLTAILGNPILIQVKYGNVVDKEIHFVETLAKNLINTSSKAAILFYLDRNNKRLNFKGNIAPLILAWDFEDFLKMLIRNSFEDIIMKRRNQLAHGVSN
ncbi:restriction endonuclease [Paenibacillus sp. LHD-38]|uniref:restriction endonuclease n=1 Tax=Paenibacillus sp. LHD-38 TaxID=3072143 RepID=UPI00280EEE1B|nr:hypothetical protein [Paenibacillus sp. LHD-38]MDQ8734254.1 hypothetical protein [Paenibacillus sp. LHD-38]